jgi:hypothetical protein
MSDPDGGGHESEGPAWNNLWGYKESVGDPLQMLHDAPDAWNGMNQMMGLTQTAQNANSLHNSAGLAEHLAQNAEAMGNTGMAERFASRASAYEAFSTERGGLNAFMESPLMKVGGNATGAVLGGLQMYNGINEIRGGNATQGGMDVAAGGLGTFSSGVGLAGGLGLLGEGSALAAAGTVAAPLAVAAGLAAAGNSYTKDHNMFGFLGINPAGGGTWGVGADGKPRDSLQFVGDTTASAYRGTNNAVQGALGHGWLGQGAGAVAGGLAGAGTALGTGALALGTDIVGGGIAVGQGIGNLAGAAGRGIASGASAVGRGIGSAASAVGSGISSAAHSVGNFVSHLW